VAGSAAAAKKAAVTSAAAATAATTATTNFRGPAHGACRHAPGHATRKQPTEPSA
jgi:hypothetical protein